MKKPPLLIIFLLAYLLMLYFSQWWYVEFADGARVVLYGFPLAYTASGHGVQSVTELYLLECIVDYATYAAFLYLLYRIFKQYLIDVVLPKTVTIILWALVSVHALYFIWTILISGNWQVYSKIPYVVSYMLKKGFAFGWQEYLPGI